MPQMVEASSYFPEDLPDRQVETVFNLMENRGYDRNSYLSNTPVAITPDGKSVLKVTWRPDDSFGSVGVAPAAVDGGNVSGDLPIMDKQDMLHLAR